MQSVCGSCLSVGRHLYSLGDNRLLFQTLVAEISQACAVCWECAAMLRRTRAFRDRARLAGRLLRDAHSTGAEFSPYNTLSTLVKSIQTDCIELTFDDYDSESLVAESPASYCPEQVLIKKEVAVKGEEETGAMKGEEEMGAMKRVARRKVKRMRKKQKIYKSLANTLIKTKADMNARFKMVRMCRAEMLRARDEDRSKPFYMKAPHRCETCIYGYYREQQYRDHVREKHSQTSGAHVCDVCCCRFERPALLASHARSHYRLYRCRVCAQQHRDAKRMLRHYETQHETDKRFPCSDCDRVFPRYYALRYHRESCHRDSTECQHCGKVLSSRTNYRRHLMLHTGMPTRECKICHKKFRGDALYQSHLRVHNTEAPPDAYCAECNIHFKHMYIYRQHVKYSSKHITPDLLKFPCTLCERKFRQQGHLKRHFDAVHLKKTKYVCPHCDKNICSSSALRTHIRTVHEKVPAKKDKVCDICAKTFAKSAD